MAGAGYKLFATGDVLTAAQVNTYLMQQTVMVFADSAARTTALSGVLAEGMVSYLQDTNTLEVYNGSGWVGATGDITGLTAGTGISITSETGPVPTVTNAMATEITAKGDLIVGTGSATFDNLAAGSNGDTLVADSSTSTGLRWQQPVQQNPVLNSAMQVWQRGTSITSSTGIYTADRWLAYRAGATSTISRQATGDTTNLPNIQYCARFQRNSGTATAGFSYFSQSFESVNSIPFAGKTVTFSFYARAGANFSAPSSQIVAKLATGTGTDQNVITGTYTGIITAINQTVTLTTTWQRFTATATLSSSLTELATYFEWDSVGTAGANDYVEITGVQLEVGSVATPFKTYAATIQGELVACQRYYQVSTIQDVLNIGMCPSTTESKAPQNFFNEMRVAPTVVIPSSGSTAGTISFLKADGTYPGTIGTISALTITKNGFLYVGTGFTGAFVAGNASFLYASGSTEVWKASAEL
jgi:hypothetical protein